MFRWTSKRPGAKPCLELPAPSFQNPDQRERPARRHVSGHHGVRAVLVPALDLGLICLRLVNRLLEQLDVQVNHRLLLLVRDDFGNHLVVQFLDFAWPFFDALFSSQASFQVPRVHLNVISRGLSAVTVAWRLRASIHRVLRASTAASRLRAGVTTRCRRCPDSASVRRAGGSARTDRGAVKPLEGERGLVDVGGLTVAALLGTPLATCGGVSEREPPATFGTQRFFARHAPFGRPFCAQEVVFG